jgi:hypothetical protein
MKIDNAVVSAKDKTVAMRVGAVKKAGCAKLYTAVMSGVRSDRPASDPWNAKSSTESGGSALDCK